jgi:hypothetical protein
MFFGISVIVGFGEFLWWGGEYVVLFAGWRPQKAPHVLPYLRDSL